MREYQYPPTAEIDTPVGRIRIIPHGPDDVGVHAIEDHTLELRGVKYCGCISYDLPEVGWNSRSFMINRQDGKFLSSAARRDLTRILKEAMAAHLKAHPSFLAVGELTHINNKLHYAEKELKNLEAQAAKTTKEIKDLKVREVAAKALLVAKQAQE